MRKTCEVMLTQELLNIVEILLNMNPVFHDGFIHNRRDKARGLGQSAGNYFFFVEYVDVAGHNGFFIEPAEGAKGVYIIAERWKLLVNIKCVDRFLILKRLIGQLILKTPGLIFEIAGYSTDSESIFLNETGKKLQQDIDIIRIDFTIKKMISTAGLDCLPICDFDCC